MSTRWSSRLKLSTHHSRFKQKQGLQLPRNQYSRNFLTVNPLESALPRTAPTTPAESTLTKPHESVSKQTTLTLAECALTSFSTSLSKQRTSSLIESTLTRFVTVTPLESALTKKVGGEGGVHALTRPLPLDRVRSSTWTVSSLQMPFAQASAPRTAAPRS